MSAVSVATAQARSGLSRKSGLASTRVCMLQYTKPRQAGCCSFVPSYYSGHGMQTSARATFGRMTSRDVRGFNDSNGGGSTGGGGGGSGGGKGDGGDESSGKGFFGMLWVMYLASLNKNPVRTKALTSGFLNAFGDVLAQFAFNEEGQAFDWKRLGIFTFLGIAFIGPSLHVWYGSIARLFSNPGTASALSRLVLDQVFFAPIFIGGIVSAVMFLEGQGHHVPAKLKSDLFTIVKSNWVLWVPFQFINFRFVPQHLQVLASNVVALGWNTYMSWMSHK